MFVFADLLPPHKASACLNKDRTTHGLLQCSPSNQFSFLGGKRNEKLLNPDVHQQKNERQIVIYSFNRITYSNEIKTNQSYTPKRSESQSTTLKKKSDIKEDMLNGSIYMVVKNRQK